MQNSTESNTTLPDPQVAHGATFLLESINFKFHNIRLGYFHKTSNAGMKTEKL